MARREYAQLYTRIWSDEDFRARSSEAQRLYILTLSQASLDYAGVTPLTVRRWANCSATTTVADVETALAELEEHRYVVIDRETEELLVRSYIRNDELWKQPRMLGLALREALEVQSPKLRTAIAAELRRLPESARVDKGAPTVSGTADLLSGGAPPPAPPPTPGGHEGLNGMVREGVQESGVNGSGRAHDASGAPIRNEPGASAASGSSSQVGGPEPPPDEGLPHGVGQGTRARAPAAPGTWHLAPGTYTAAAWHGESRPRANDEPPPHPEPPSPSIPEPPPGPAITGPTAGDAYRLVDRTIGREHPYAVRTELAIQAGTLLVTGTSSALISEALELWLAKPHLGPRALPNLVSEAIRLRAGPATNGLHQRDAEALRYLGVTGTDGMPNLIALPGGME